MSRYLSSHGHSDRCFTPVIFRTKKLFTLFIQSSAIGVAKPSNMVPIIKMAVILAVVVTVVETVTVVEDVSVSMAVP